MILRFSIFLALMLPISLFAESPHKKLSHGCDECHQTSNWHDVTFDHKDTGFPLQAGHERASCLFCHDVRDFSKTSPECQTCHTDVHKGQFPYSCASCHNERGWRDIDSQTIHARSFTVLIGPHNRLDCESCHRQGAEQAFRMVESQCSSCHEESYQATANPNHAELGFPRQCDQCHSMMQWIPATFIEHDARFPISSGNHAGIWDSCTICHYEKGNFRTFTCLSCHEHSPDRTAGEHDEVSGYVYESDACFRCHPRGEGDD